MAQALLTYETLEGKYIYEIVKEGKLISEISPKVKAKGTENNKENKTKTDVSTDQKEASNEHK